MQTQADNRQTHRPISLRIASTIALTPAIAVTLICFYVFIGWTIIISFTRSRLLPTYEFVGLAQYRRLFASEHWWAALQNLAIFTSTTVLGCLLVGYTLAILIDRGTRWESVYRTVFLLPLCISFVVTGLLWQWLLNPVLGIQNAVRSLGWENFAFDWLVRSDRAVYTLSIAAIWQQAGLCMALFLAGMRGIDPNIWRVAKVDGIPTWRVYTHVIAPLLRPVFLTATILLLCMTVKSFDLVVTLTSGGPGFSSDLPARYIVDLMAHHELGMAAAGACILLFTVAAAVGPYLYLDSRRKKSA